MDTETEATLVGQTLVGRYQIDSVIGQGGMAVVYGATDSVLRRQVAVKVVSAALADQAAVVERFLREARAVACLDHPNIVAVFDLGVLPDGRPFQVMERIWGRSLRQLLEQEGPQPPTRVAELLSEAAEALEAVHAQGMVHRDLKLENLMLAEMAGGLLQLKLLDFGIAAFLRGGDPRLTRRGHITGTPLTLAPEAVFSESFDHRVDVYGLAVVAYQLLTGRAPFESQDTLTLLHRKVLEPAPPLDARGMGFSSAVEAAVALGLARDPSQRAPSARAFVDTLARAATNTSKIVVEPTRDVAAPPRRSRWPYYGGALALGAATVTLWALNRPTSPPEPTPEIRLVKTEDGPLRPSRDLPPVSERRSPPLQPEPPKPVIKPPPPQPEPPPPQVIATVFEPEVAARLAQEAQKALLRGRLAEAIQTYQRATHADPRHGPAWRGLGLAYERMGRAPEAIDAYERYLEGDGAAADAPQIRQRMQSLRNP